MSTTPIHREGKQILDIVLKACNAYKDHGSRSSKKVICLHNGFKTIIDNNLPGNYKCVIEENVSSCNTSGLKKCDIVILKQKPKLEFIEKNNHESLTVIKERCRKLNIPYSKLKRKEMVARINISTYYTPYIIFPVKFVMSNYFQNRNNNWETLLGEVTQLNMDKWTNNTGIIIIPINLIFSRIPYLNKDKTIKSFEHITYEKSFKITEMLTKPFYTHEHKNLVQFIEEQTLSNNDNAFITKLQYLANKKTYLCHDIINYIIDVEQRCNVGDKYNKCPNLIGFNKETPYRPFSTILDKFCN